MLNIMLTLFQVCIQIVYFIDYFINSLFRLRHIIVIFMVIVLLEYFYDLLIKVVKFCHSKNFYLIYLMLSGTYYAKNYVGIYN